VTGVRNHLVGFVFSFSDGEDRLFYGVSFERAREYAITWGKSHGGLTVTGRAS
jgi:hypothetical protein